jgi:hypothetical protein
LAAFTRVLAATALFTSMLAHADGEPAFSQLRQAALSAGQGGAVEGLGTFLDRYVGDCASASGGRRECEQNARAFRQKSSGKKFYLVLDEDSVSQVSPGRADGGQYSVNITPFFGANGYALTLGAPRKTDPRGNPLLPYVTVRQPLPESWDASTLERLIRLRALKMQLVFTPQDVWTLPKRGGGRIHGVRARIHAIRVEETRTGNTVALWLERGA